MDCLLPSAGSFRIFEVNLTKLCRLVTYTKLFILNHFIACPNRACNYKLRVCLSVRVSDPHAWGIGI